MFEELQHPKAHEIEIKSKFVPESEKQHFEETKVKNISKVYFGSYFEITPWYYSPYPEHENDYLVLCEFCLSYFRDKAYGAAHIKSCPI